jgi:hypothetical protein
MNKTKQKKEFPNTCKQHTTGRRREREKKTIDRERRKTDRKPSFRSKELPKKSERR